MAGTELTPAIFLDRVGPKPNNTRDGKGVTMEEVEGMSGDRMMIAFRRAQRTLRIRDVNCDCPIFQREFGDQLARLACEDALALAQERGVLTVSSVDDNGERRWVAEKVLA